jgi:hypothetical protein
MPTARGQHWNMSLWRVHYELESSWALCVTGKCLRSAGCWLGSHSASLDCGLATELQTQAQQSQRHWRSTPPVGQAPTIPPRHSDIMSGCRLEIKRWRYLQSSPQRLYSYIVICTRDVGARDFGYRLKFPYLDITWCKRQVGANVCSIGLTMSAFRHRYVYDRTSTSHSARIGTLLRAWNEGPNVCSLALAIPDICSWNGIVRYVRISWRKCRKYKYVNICRLESKACAHSSARNTRQGVSYTSTIENSGIGSEQRRAHNVSLRRVHLNAYIARVQD